MASTLAQLVTRTEQRLSMVAGTSVQLYSEDRIAEMIQHKFDVLFIEAWWPQFMTWYTWTLDGTNGQVTVDVTNIIKDYQDIRRIFPSGSNTPLTELGSTVNPLQLSGTTPMHFESDIATDKRFHIWPKTATGNIIVHVRTKPATFISSDEINFDEQALILGAAYDYAEDDGTNPGGTEKLQNLFEARVQQSQSQLNDAPLSLNPLTTNPNTFTFTAL